jgi:dynein heavy chain
MIQVTKLENYSSLKLKIYIGGNVERWLIEVEIMMKKSLAYATDFAMKDFLQSDRIEWLKRWQGQVIICVNQTRWCADVEKTIIDGLTGIGLHG